MTLVSAVPVDPPERVEGSSLAASENLHMSRPRLRLFNYLSAPACKVGGIPRAFDKARAEARISGPFHLPVSVLVNATRAGDVAGREGDLVVRIGRLAARSGQYTTAGPFLIPDRQRAIQSEPRSPSSPPEAAAQSDELGRL